MAVPVEVGVIVNLLSDRADQWAYIREVVGPYVFLSGIHSTHMDVKMRKSVLRNVVNDYNYGSNGLRLHSGDILGLSGDGGAEGVLFLEGEDE